jgi:transcriptional regulator with XRE-family HTH domain
VRLGLARRMRKNERDLLTRISTEVRRLRKERGWSQLELAERAELSLNYVSLIERAEQLPTLRVLLQLVGPLSTTLSALVTTDDGDAVDPWLREATSILLALPQEVRPMALGVLRGMTTSTDVPRTKPRRRTPRAE